MMMASLAVMYTVRATFPDEAIRSRYIEWLANGHAQAVMDGGATAAVIVQLDSEPAPASGTGGAFKVEARYRRRSLGGRHVAGDDPHGRRLAGAIGTQKSEDFT